jgi:hypothetical protein
MRRTARSVCRRSYTMRVIRVARISRVTTAGPRSSAATVLVVPECVIVYFPLSRAMVAELPTNRNVAGRVAGVVAPIVTCTPAGLGSSSTYGRCPNGSGAFTTTALASPVSRHSQGAVLVFRCPRDASRGTPTSSGTAAARCSRRSTTHGAHALLAKPHRRRAYRRQRPARPRSSWFALLARPGRFKRWPHSAGAPVAGSVAGAKDRQPGLTWWSDVPGSAAVVTHVQQHLSA